MCVLIMLIGKKEGRFFIGRKMSISTRREGNELHFIGSVREQRRERER